MQTGSVTTECWRVKGQVHLQLPCMHILVPDRRHVSDAIQVVAHMLPSPATYSADVCLLRQDTASCQLSSLPDICHTQVLSLNATECHCKCLTCLGVDSQAHQASHRQPFSQLTNMAGEASPPVRQQPVGIAEGVRARHNSQTLSMDRITPTPSPVLSSSTDMPYSPFMR